MSKLTGKHYRGFIPSKELPFVVGDRVPVRAGTTVYVCSESGDILGEFALSTKWMVTIESIFNGEITNSPKNGEPNEDHLFPRFGWKDDDLWLQVGFQELLEQGAIPPRQIYV